MAYNLRLKDDIAVFTKRLFYALCDDAETQKIEFSELGETFCKLVSHTSKEDVETLWDLFLQKMPSIKESIAQDAIATEQNDPACKGLQEVYLAYPGFHAIPVYRLSHELFKLDLPIISRMMSEYIHGITGIDIHPGATIGNSFFIDHGTGIVIGETTIIKNNVKIYQGVTLGGLSIKKSLSSIKRHPTIENNVTIYANATILGGDVTIGANSVVGANVWITQSVPENSLVTYQSEIKISKRKK
ncbi:MAG: serine O-acetyltransferase [Flavobacteriaceae bacterium]